MASLACFVVLFLLNVGVPSMTGAQQETEAFAELQRKYATALDDIARLKRELADARKTIEQLQQRLNATSESQPNEGLQEGLELLAQKRYDNAITLLTKHLNTNPQDATAYRSRGMAHLHLGNAPLAMRDLDRAIRLDPKDAVAYNQRGILHYQLGQSQQALKDFTRAIRLQPKLAQSYNNRGLTYRRLGDYALALQNIERAAQLGLQLATASLTLLHDEIRQVQKTLREAGFKPGPADGIPGPKTTAALRQYQKKQGLPPTGRLDPPTKQALGLQTAQPQPPHQSVSEPPPRFVSQTKPEYPLEARQRGWEGTVALRLELLADGTVGEVEIDTSSGYPILDTAAQDAARTWRHEPITRDGTPVTRWVRLTIHFALDNTAATTSGDRGEEQ